MIWTAVIGGAVAIVIAMITLQMNARVLPPDPPSPESLTDVTSTSVSPDIIISFHEVPELWEGPGRPAGVSGMVSGVPTPAQFKIVLYSYTNHWHVQPFKTDPFTDVNAGGAWQNVSHPGTQYAALLVRPSYRPPPETASLPHVGGDVIAKAILSSR